MAIKKELSGITFATEQGADMGGVVYNPNGNIVNAAEIFWGITAANMPKDVDSMPDKIENSGDLIKAIKYAA